MFLIRALGDTESLRVRAILSELFRVSCFGFLLFAGRPLSVAAEERFDKGRAKKRQKSEFGMERWDE
jgi:hypothetical protein